MTATAELKLLREEIDLLGPRSPSRRYPPELKARILEWVRAQREAGAGRNEVSESLSIPWVTLKLWRQDAQLTGEAAEPGGKQLQPVRVVRRKAQRVAPRREVRALTLRTPEGFAIEGLDVEAVVALLRRLR
ncbi:MAG: transposase [Myxococcaceae bacterium]